MKSIARAQTDYGLVCSHLAAVLGQNSDSFGVNVNREADVMSNPCGALRDLSVQKTDL